MFDDILWLKSVWDLLLGALWREPDHMTSLVARVIVPVLAATWMLSSLGMGTVLNIEPPAISFMSIQSEHTASGEIKDRGGSLIRIEPQSREYEFVFQQAPASVFFSIDSGQLRANEERIRVRENRVSVTAPLLGHGDAVELFVSSPINNEVLVPGGRVEVSRHTRPSALSVSVATGATYAALFALGFAVAACFPTPDPLNETGRQKGAKPNENHIVERDIEHSDAGVNGIVPCTQMNCKIVPRE